MSGPPSFTALKFATFRKKARMPVDQKEHERGHGRGWEPILPEGEVVVEREGEHFQEGEGGVLSVSEEENEDDVQQLECAKGLAFPRGASW